MTDGDYMEPEESIKKKKKNSPGKTRRAGKSVNAMIEVRKREKWPITIKHGLLSF